MFARLISADVPPPPCVQIETTTRCNLRCIMCPKGANGEIMGDLSASTLENLGGLIDNAWEIRAHGFGETFLNRDFEKILRRCGDGQATISIVTNGTLIDERRAHLLIDAGVETIYVSIDAADPELFRVIRKTSLKKIVDNLLRLQMMKLERRTPYPRIVMQMVGMSNNIHDLPGMIRLTASVGSNELNLVAFTEFDMETVHSLKLRSLLDCPDEARRWLAESQVVADELGVHLDVAHVYRELMAPPREVHAPPLVRPGPLALVRKAFAHALSGDFAGLLAGIDRKARLGVRRAGSVLRHAIEWGVPTSPARDGAASTLSALRPAPRLGPSPKVRCTDPWNAVMINYKGEVNPCCMSQRVMGNVNDSTFEAIWDGDVYRGFREQLLSDEPPPECRNCAKAGWHHPFELDDWIEVGVNDAFGVQLGTGWCEAILNGVRWTREQALLRLRNSGKRRLRLELASWEDPRYGLERRGSVRVNEVRVGDFEVASRNATQFTYDLPPSDASELVVRLVSDWTDTAGDTIDVRRLGVGFRSAALVE